MVTTLTLVVLVCLFPVWPDFLKLIIFYISLSLLYFLLGIMVVRLIIWALFRIFGKDFWLFPNLNADVGPLESFVPLYECNNTEDEWAEYLGRIIALGLTIYLIFILRTDPTILSEY